MSAFATWLFDARRPSWGVLADVAGKRAKTNRMPLQWRIAAQNNADGLNGVAITARMFRATVTEGGTISGFWLYVDNSELIALESAFFEGGTDQAEVGDEFTADVICGFTITGVPETYSAAVPQER